MATSSSMSSNDPTHIRSDADNMKGDEAPLPAPTTTRNRIPRSRATSLARSRGSSRASSASRSRNGSRAASRAGSVVSNLSPPGSRAGRASSIDGVSRNGSWTASGLLWQPGMDMDSLDDELGYVGVGASGSGAGPSGSSRWAVEDALAPMSSKAKGKKRARSTPEEEGEGSTRSKARVASPQPERSQPASQDHEYTMYPTMFSFTTQTQPEGPPATQLTSSFGSSTLASTATLGSLDDVPTGSSSTFHTAPDFTFGFSAPPGSPQGSSAFTDYSLQESAISSTQAQAGSSFDAAPPYEKDFGGGSTSGSSLGPEGYAVAGGSSLNDAGGPGSQAASSSSSAQASSSSVPAVAVPSSAPILPPTSILAIPRPPTPPPQPDLLSSYTCPICFFPPNNATLTPCGHICCGSCLFTAVESSQSRNGMVFASSAHGEALCPVCRATIPGWDGKGGGVIGLRVRSVISI